MSHHRLLETVAAELRQQGLPSADVARLLQELDDHVADIIAEQGGSMDIQVQANERIQSRLGRPEVLVAAALANRRNFFGRHPILSFVVAPIPVAVLSWIVFLFVSFGLLEIVGWMLGPNYVIEGRAARDWPAVLVHAVNALDIAIRFLPPAMAAVLMCWCAARAGMSWKWTLTACGLVAVVAWSLVVQVHLPEEPGQGTIMVGLGWPMLKWINLMQLFVPVGVGAAFLLGIRNGERPATDSA